MKQTKLFLSLLMLLVFGIGNVWGEEVTISTTKTSGKSADGLISYTTAKENGNTAPAENSSGVKVYAKGSFTVSTSDENVTITKIKYTYTLNANSKGKSPTIASVRGKNNAGQWNATDKIWTGSDKSITLSTSGEAGNTQFANIVVTYTSGSSTEPSLSVDKTKIDFGTVEQGGTVEAQTIAVTMANIETVLADFEAGCIAFSVSPKELSASGNLTITPKTSVAVGEYTSTLTITDGNEQEQTVVVKMNIVAPTTGKKLEFDLTKNNLNLPTTKTTTKEGEYTYNLNGTDYKFYATDKQGSADGGVYFASSHVMIYEKNSLGLPALSEYKLVKVVVANSSSCSAKVYVSITDGKNVVTGGEAQKFGTQSGTYTFSLSGTTANTMYYLSVASANCQVIGLTLYYEAVEAVKSTVTLDVNPENAGVVSATYGNPATEIESETTLVPENAIVTLSYLADDNYRFKEWDVQDANNKDVTLTKAEGEENYTFTMPALAVTATANFVQLFTITKDEVVGGTLTVSATSAAEGDKVAVSATPDTKYKDPVIIVYKEGDETTTYDVAEGKFTMPNNAVRVKASFTEIVCDPLATPVITIGETTYNTATISWNAVEHADKYIVTLQDNSDVNVVEAETTELTYTFTSLSGNTSYICIVKAVSNDVDTYCESEEAMEIVSTTDNPAATITLLENGVENATKLNGTVGEAITLPSTAGGNCSKSVEFVGWSEEEIAKTDAQPTSKFYAPGAEYTPTAENVTLYAVYAKSMRQVLLSEDFSTLKGDLDNSNTKWDGNANFTGNNAYQAGGIVKLGTSSKTGSLTSKETLTITAGNTINVSFDVLGWTNVEGDIKVTVGTDSKTLTYTATKSDNFESKSVDFVLTKDNPTITIATTAKRAFIDNVVVATKGYSNYSTTCAVGIDVAMPTFSVAGGEYAEAQSVEIRCATEGATIYYTTDGTEPTDKSTKYTEAIKVDQSMTIKAIAYVGEDNYSAVATAEYVVLQNAEVEWQTYAEDGSSKVKLTEATIYTDDDLYIFVYTPSYGKQTFTSTNENVAIVETGEDLGLSVKGAGTTTITVNVETDGTFASGSASFVLHVIEHKKIVAMSFAKASYNATLGEEFAAPKLTINPSVTPIVYSSSNENVAKVNAETGEITLAGMGTTTIMAAYAGDDTYDPAKARYTLNVTDPNTDIIDVAFTGMVYDKSIIYGDWEKEGTNTHTIYKGNSAQSKPEDGSGIQIRTSNSNSGIVSTHSKGFIKSVSITFVKTNTNGIDIYGNLTPYTSVGELYDGGTQGVKLVSLTGKEEETATFTVTNGNYPYIGIRSNKNAAYIKQIAIAWTPTEVVRTGLTEGKFGTICLEKNVTTSLGASFYEIAYREDQNGEPYKVFFDEVTEPEAGVPYIFLAEDEQITVVYGNETATEASSHNGLVGTFKDIMDGNAGTAGNMLENNYLVNNNQIRKCGGNCSLPAYRAYIRMEDVPTNVVAPQPGRRRVTLNNAATGTATGWEGISEDSTVAPQQEGIYDVLGRKLESAESGFYIINGKKQVIVK